MMNTITIVRLYPLNILLSKWKTLMPVSPKEKIQNKDLYSFFNSSLDIYFCEE